MNGTFHLAFATTDLKRIKAFYGKFLGCPEGRSAETWVDYDFFGHQLTIQEVPKLIKTARIYNPKSNVPSDHWGIVLSMERLEEAARQTEEGGLHLLHRTAR
jgi:extradiol dioxygenase family protein